VWASLLFVAFLEAGGVVPGRSCEPGGRFVSTTGTPHLASASAVGAVLLSGALAALTLKVPEPSPAPSSGSAAP
jgi:hypothetical protein